MSSEKMKEIFDETMNEIASQIRKNSNIINKNDIVYLIDLILQVRNTKNKIFVYGAGRSGFVGRCFAQRLMHLGIKSCFVSDAVTYQYTKNDLLVLISGSGETTSSTAIAQKAREIGGKIALLTVNINSSIGKLSDCVIKIEGKSKDMAVSEKTFAPYTSLFDISTLSVLDSIGGVLMNILGVTEVDIDKRHASIE
ncbi:MAG: 6-phospho-3-hexuloisomerase [Candidatus Thorarchaeota archaeon]